MSTGAVPPTLLPGKWYAVVIWQPVSRPFQPGSALLAAALATKPPNIDEAVLNALDGRPYTHLLERAVIVQLQAQHEVSVLYGALTYVTKHVVPGAVSFVISPAIPATPGGAWSGIAPADWVAVNEKTLAIGGALNPLLPKP